MFAVIQRRSTPKSWRTNRPNGEILFHENFPLLRVQELRQIGHDVLTSLEAGKANLAVPDEEVLTFAATEGRAVLTLNRKQFVRLHRHHVEHSGIVVCTYGANQARLATRINQAVATPNHADKPTTSPSQLLNKSRTAPSTRRALPAFVNRGHTIDSIASRS